MIYNPQIPGIAAPYIPTHGVEHIVKSPWPDHVAAIRTFLRAPGMVPCWRAWREAEASAGSKPGRGWETMGAGDHGGLPLISFLVL